MASDPICEGLLASAGLAPFDSVAAEYDDRFTKSPFGRRIRDAVRRHARVELEGCKRVLDLGCGSGEDARWLADLGARVDALDVSPAMLAVARLKVEGTVTGQVRFRCFDLANAPERGFAGLFANEAEESNEPYDGVLSNFGALNCLPDRTALAASLAWSTRPGGRVLLVLMGPWCLWEIVWFGLRGQRRNAFRRWSREARARIGPEASLRVWYPSPLRLHREFAPWFRHVKTVGIGNTLPPPLLDRWGAHPRLGPWVDRWARLDELLGGIFPWNSSGDHYLAVFERRREPVARPAAHRRSIKTPYLRSPRESVPCEGDRRRSGRRENHR